MFTPIPNGVRVVHIGSFGSIPIINTVGAQNGVGETGSSLDSIASDHATAWRSHIVPMMLTGYHHTATLAYSLEDQSAAVGDAGLTTVATGTDSTAPGALSNCFVIALKTAKRGRTYQGRMFLSGYPQSAVETTGVTWRASWISAIQANVQAYANDVNPVASDNGKIAVCSKGSALHGIAPHTEGVTSFICRPGIGTQRRRLS